MTLSKSKLHAKSRVPDGPSVCSALKLLGERGRTADAVDALRAGQRDGYDAFGKDMLGRLRRDRFEIRDVGDRGESGDGKGARRIEMRAGMFLIGRVTLVGGVASRVIDALDDRGLVRTERELQAVRIGREHETDRQKCTRYQ
jgi:hypothetical protein